LKRVPRSGQDTPSGAWNENRFLRVLEEERGEHAGAVAREVFRWVRERGLKTSWGRGAFVGNVYVGVLAGKEPIYPISVSTEDRLYLQFGSLKSSGPWRARKARADLLEELNSIPGVAFQEDRIDRYPSTRLSELPDDSLGRLLGALAQAFEDFKGG
jgi:hypothetical protein